MPHIIPIRDLKNTSEVSDICHREDGPIFVTKNGYGDMVIMSMEVYEKMLFMNDVYRKLEEAEKAVARNETAYAFETVKEMRAKHGL